MNLGRSRSTLIAAGVWVVIWVLGDAALETQPWFGFFLSTGSYVLGILVFLFLWNLDGLREAWRTDRARIKSESD